MYLKLKIGDILIGNINTYRTSYYFTRVILDDPKIDELTKSIILLTDRGLVKLIREIAEVGYTLNHLITGINFSINNNTINFGEGRLVGYSRGSPEADEDALCFKNFTIICKDIKEFCRK